MNPIFLCWLICILYTVSKFVESIIDIPLDILDFINCYMKFNNNNNICNFNTAFNCYSTILLQQQQKWQKKNQTNIPKIKNWLKIKTKLKILETNKIVGKSHLASVRIVGNKAYNTRRATTCFDDDKVRNDVNLLSYYLKNRKAAAEHKEPVVVLESCRYWLIQGDWRINLNARITAI